mgnify:CR=1 FL=1
MDDIFEVIDKSRRKIRLTEKQWKHILKRHPDMINYLEEIKNTLINPLKITDYSEDEEVRYYYKYIKYKDGPYKYLLVSVKYLNGDGFVVTAYFEKHIK